MGEDGDVREDKRKEGWGDDYASYCVPTSSFPEYCEHVFSTYYVIYAKFIGSLVVWFVPTQLQYGFQDQILDPGSWILYTIFHKLYTYYLCYTTKWDHLVI